MRIKKQKKFDANTYVQGILNLHKATGFCEKHGAFNCLIKQGQEVYCPHCLQEKKDREELEIYKKQKVNNILVKIDGLPKRYEFAGFKNFEQTEKNKDAYKSVLEFAKKPKNTWLLLLGKNGTGKTHLAHAILKYTGGIYRDFDDIATDFLDAQAGLGNGLNATIDKYAGASMLVIDEIDKVKATQGRIAWLNIILRKRYNNLLPVVLCGNIDLDNLCKNIDLNSGEALKDRIQEVGEVVLFDWESYRKNLRGE